MWYMIVPSNGSCNIHVHHFLLCCRKSFKSLKSLLQIFVSERVNHPVSSWDVILPLKSSSNSEQVATYSSSLRLPNLLHSCGFWSVFSLNCQRFMCLPPTANFSRPGRQSNLPPVCWGLFKCQDAIWVPHPRCQEVQGHPSNPIDVPPITTHHPAGFAAVDFFLLNTCLASKFFQPRKQCISSKGVRFFEKSYHFWIGSWHWRRHLKDEHTPLELCIIILVAMKDHLLRPALKRKCHTLLGNMAHQKTLPEADRQTESMWSGERLTCTVLLRWLVIFNHEQREQSPAMGKPAILQKTYFLRCHERRSQDSRLILAISCCFSLTTQHGTLEKHAQTRNLR